VIEAAVIGRRLEGDVAVIAYAIPRPGATVSPPLSSWLAEYLPAPKRPQEVHLVGALPMLSNFKPDLRALEAVDRERAATAAPTRLDAAPGDLGLVDAVKTAWCQMLPAASWDENRSWEASGGDSLKGLELVMHLELLTKRRLPVEILLRETTPQQLIANVALVAAGDTLPSPLPGITSERPVAFLLPGAAGPIAGQVEFVRSLADQFDFRILNYPSPDPTVPRIIPVEEVLAKVSTELERDFPEQPLRLLGYSYGGYLAVDLARRFALAGRQVEFVGVVDAPPLPGSGPAESGMNHPDRHIERLFVGLWQTVPKRIVGAVVRSYLKLAYWLVRHGSLTVLARLVLLIGSLGYARAQLFLWWHVTHMSRRASLLEYLPNSYPGKLWLFRVPDDPSRPLPEDYGWRRYCKELTVNWIEGEHETVFAARHVPTLSSVVRAAWEASSRTAA
jgi:thioesterase domain-containing protein